MEKIDITQVRSLNNRIKSDIGGVLKEVKNKSSNVNSKMSTVISNYSSYSNIASEAREIQRIVRDIQSKITSINSSYDKIVKGLNFVIDNVKKEEAETKKLINKNQSKIEKNSVTMRMSEATVRLGQGAKLEKEIELTDQLFLQILEGLDDNLAQEEYERLLEILSENGYVTINDLKKVGIYKDEPSLQKMCTEINEQYTIVKYLTLEDKVETLSNEACDKEIKILLEALQGKVTDREGFSGLKLNEMETEEGYEAAIEQYLALKGVSDAYELLREEPEKQKQLLLHWLIVEKIGGNIYDTPVPESWTKTKSSDVLAINEENYKEMKLNNETLKYYLENEYIVDLIKYGDEANNYQYLFENWYESQYGHLDVDSNELKRLKYLMEQGLAGISLKNEQGVYDNEITPEYKNALNLWLNLKGKYNDYWKSKEVLTSNNKILKKLIDEVAAEGNLGIESFQNPEIEKRICSGDLRPVKGFLDKYNEEVSVSDDGFGLITVTIKKVIIPNEETLYKIFGRQMRWDELEIANYSFTINYEIYKGEKYINAEAFDKAYNNYQIQHLETYGYHYDLEVINNYDSYVQEAKERLKELKTSYPDIEFTTEEMISLIRMEKERSALYSENRTMSEQIQDAGQKIIDYIALAASAMALTGNPIALSVAVVAEIANAGISYTRENYDDAVLRAAFIVAEGTTQGVSSYLKYADEGVEYITDAAKIANLSPDKIKGFVEEGDEIAVILTDGTRLICRREELTAEIEYLLKKQTGVKSSVEEIVSSAIKGVDNTLIEARLIDEAKDCNLIKRVKELRGSLTGKFKTKGNLGYCEVNIEGLDRTEFYAHSQIKNYEQIADKQFADSVTNISRQYSYEESIFKPLKVNSDNIVDGTDAWLRNVDTEHKMLEDIARQLGENVGAKGTIKLYTELPPCPSCSSVIKQFKIKYPNIKLEIIHNNGVKLK